MEINIFQKNLAQKEEEIFIGYLNQKTPAIKDLLKKFSKDNVLLKVTIEKFDKHDAFEVEFCIVIGGKSMVAKEASHQITKAIDLTKDRLISQIKKHMAMMRGDRAHKSLAKKQTAEKVLTEEYVHME